MARAQKQEVTTQEDQLPAFLQQSDNRGNENMSHDDMTIPRIQMIQDLSPQHKKSKDEYIEGAEPGMVFNTVTGELYGDSVAVVPVLFRKEHVIWKDRDHGGGFRGAFATPSEAKEALLALEDAQLCDIVETAQHFVLVVDMDSDIDNDPSYTEAVVSMSKSQMGPSRKWNAQIQTAGNARFSNIYDLKAITAQNAAGQDYYNWKPSRIRFVTEPLYRAAEKLYDAVASGERDINRDTGAEQEGVSGHPQTDIGENDEM